MHTPGPWAMYSFDTKSETGPLVKDSSGLIVAEAYPRGPSGTEQAANASLIAAAPELLEALQLLHDNLAEYQRINHLGGYDNQDMVLARAAIAKAKGEK